MLNPVSLFTLRGTPGVYSLSLNHLGADWAASGIFINNQHYWDILEKIMSFDKTVRDLGIVIGDCALSFADSSGSVFVDPDLLCSRLLVKLIGW